MLEPAPLIAWLPHLSCCGYCCGSVPCGGCAVKLCGGSCSRFRPRLCAGCSCGGASRRAGLPGRVTSTLVQDDMKLAPDFFSFFNATAPLLDRDPSLFCVSSWNDHGQAQFVRDPARLVRSDFFPGLGWMLTRAVWQDIRCVT